MEEKDEVIDNLDELMEDKQQDELQSEYSIYEEKIYEIDIRLQELIIMLEQLEEKALSENDEDKYRDEYNKYLDEYEKLDKEKKQIIKEYKSSHKTILDQISIWVIFYGLISCIISFPIYSWNIWFTVFDKIATTIPGIDNSDFIFYVIRMLEIFAVPLVLNWITWILHSNVKMNKPTKKLFNIFWIIQAVMSLGMMIYCCIILFEVL